MDRSLQPSRGMTPTRWLALTPLLIAACSSSDAAPSPPAAHAFSFHMKRPARPGPGGTTLRPEDGGAWIVGDPVGGYQIELSGWPTIEEHDTHLHSGAVVPGVVARFSPTDAFACSFTISHFPRPLARDPADTAELVIDELRKTGTVDGDEVVEIAGLRGRRYQWRAPDYAPGQTSFQWELMDSRRANAYHVTVVANDPKLAADVIATLRPLDRE